VSKREKIPESKRILIAISAAQHPDRETLLAAGSSPARGTKGPLTCGYDPQVRGILRPKMVLVIFYSSNSASFCGTSGHLFQQLMVITFNIQSQKVARFRGFCFPELGRTVTGRPEQ
jgi:hypothetical protein